MSVPLPPYPPSASGPSGSTDPGRIPLRPLTVGDLLGGGFALVRRHLGVLAPLAIVIALISVGAQLGIMAGTGALEIFASGQWLSVWSQGMADGRLTALPTGMYLGVVAGSVISIAGALLLAGVAAICAAEDAVTAQPDRALIGSQVRAALPRLIPVAVLVAVAVVAGSFLFLIPGVLFFAQWGVAGPIMALERTSAARPLARSSRLTRGHRMRLVGVTLLVVVITAIIEAVIGSFVAPVGYALGLRLSTIGELLLTDGVGALVAGVTTSWVAAVIALTYIDMRLRSENLASALRAAAR